LAAVTPRPALVFIGFMGAGKTTAARAAAAALGAHPLDADELLERELGMPIAEFFEREGEGAFREREEATVLEALDRADGGVVALGGGALHSPRVRDALARHVAVLVDVDLETAWARASRSGRRPLARDRDGFAALFADREALYQRAADALVPSSDPAVVQRAVPYLVGLPATPAGTRLVWAHAASGDYPVLLGVGLLEAGWWPLGGGRYAVSDTTVFPLHGRHVEPLSASVLLEPGEGSKTLEVAGRVWRELARAGMARGDHVVALGGGVVGDVAGFCAATYQRGVDVVHVPTTLVAQVDSAYGGKTGIDLPEAKNYVGAYHQPGAVLVDPGTLSTLPKEELAAGYVEVVKTALIAGGELWERVRAGGAVAEPDVILACARTKLAVVAADERDTGPRQVLNLGHTVGHAIEAATAYTRYRHGEAVGLGLLAALRLSGRDELRDEVGELLAAQGLPARLEGADPDAVVAAVARDKKRLAGGPVPFVLVEAPGDVRYGCSVDEAELRAAVQELARSR
jgi:shikimate kinase / 3-dehydroquinate synthase